MISKKIFYQAIFITCLLLLTACSPVDSTKLFNDQQAANLLHENHVMQPTQQMVKISLPNKCVWKKMDMSLGTVGTPIMLIPNDASISNWNQSIRTKILAFRQDNTATPIKMFQNELFAAKQDCQCANGTILSQQKNNIVYRIDKLNCRNERNQTQIGKALEGRDAIYLVYYSAVPGQISPSQIHQLSRVIQAAKLMRYGLVG